MKSQDRFEVLLEHLHAKMDTVLEGLGILRQDVTDLKTDMAMVKQGVDELKLNMRVVKQVLREHSHEIAQLRT